MPDQDDSPEHDKLKDSGQPPSNYGQKFPGASVSHEDELSDEQMQLPGEKEHKAFAPKFKSKKPSRSSKKAWIILAVLISILLIGGLAWTFIPSKEQKPNNVAPKNDQNSSQSTKSSDEETVLGTEDLNDSHTNDFLRLTFKHPSSWKVSDENDVILIKSPSFSYTKADGSDQEGYFQLYIKQKATSSDGKYLGRGYAVASSEELAYADPQSGQRASTFVTNFGLDETNNFAYFVIQGNFRLKKGETLGPKFASEADAFLIAGGFSSTDKEEPMETNLLDLKDYATEQTYKTAIEIVKSLQLK